MTDYDNNMRGAIWKNDKRESDRHPHFNGHAEVDGIQYWVSAWKRGSNDNPKAPALRFSFRRKDEPNRENAAVAATFDDDIPF
jgi:hypothetical protein